MELTKQSLRERLTGKMIELRKHELEKANTIYESITKDKSRLQRYLPWVEYMSSVADEENYIRKTALDWLDGTYFDYSIFRLSDGAFVGCAGVHNISWNDAHAELGYWVTSEGEGKGYVSEAVRLLEEELFRVGFHRIEIRCDKNNERSAAVPQRCGYQHEGTLREDKVEMGVRRTTLVWGKLRTDQ